MSQRKNALIVDDEELVRILLSEQLGELGYECTVVSSGEEALKTAAHQEFDLMMLDVKMPAMSGLEVLKRFRPDHPAICVVMLTGFVETSVAAEAMELGADDYITKPCDLEYLRTRLEGAYLRREETRESQEEPERSEAPTRKEVDHREVTKGLVNQQLHLHKRLTAATKPKRLTAATKAGVETPKHRRWWWPWAR